MILRTHYTFLVLLLFPMSQLPIETIRPTLMRLDFANGTVNFFHNWIDSTQEGGIHTNQRLMIQPDDCSTSFSHLGLLLQKIKKK